LRRRPPPAARGDGRRSGCSARARNCPRVGSTHQSGLDSAGSRHRVLRCITHTKLKITDRGFVDQVAEVVEHVRSAHRHVRGDHDTPHKSSASVLRFAAMASKFSRLKLSTGRYRSRTRCRRPAYVRGDLRICMDEYEDVADISQSRNLNCGFRQNRSTVSTGLLSLTTGGRASAVPSPRPQLCMSQVFGGPVR
jgi:hypothetical protein